MHIIQEDFLITHVTSSFKIRISVILTFVHVSPTRWTLNGSTILSEEDPGSQDFDCKNIDDFFITNQGCFHTVLNQITRSDIIQMCLSHFL